MLEMDYIPGKFKIGIIIPVHKPGKCRDSTESYRPITLVSTLYKLFERIWHSRLKTWSLLHEKSFPCPQQNAYQKHMGSITASFNLQETIAHNTELGSNCYVAFLDAAKAFDNVWHDGLFLKLFEYGIKGKPLNLIMASYEHSNIRISNEYSNAIPNSNIRIFSCSYVSFFFLSRFCLKFAQNVKTTKCQTNNAICKDSRRLSLRESLYDSSLQIALSV